MKKQLQIKELTHNMMNDVMNDFDFAKVHKIMCHLNWKWSIGNTNIEKIPSLWQIMEMAKRLLEDVTQYYGDGLCHSLSCGGLKASLDKDGVLCLQFIVSELSVIAEDYDEYVPHNNSESLKSSNKQQSKS